MKRHEGIITGVFAAAAASILTWLTVLSPRPHETTLPAALTEQGSVPPSTEKLSGEEQEEKPSRTAVERTPVTPPETNEDFQAALKEASDYIAKSREKQKQTAIEEFAASTYNLEATVPPYEEQSLENQHRRELNAARYEEVARTALRQYLDADEGNIYIWEKYMNENSCLTFTDREESRIRANGYAPSISVQKSLSFALQVDHAVRLIDAYLKLKHDPENQNFNVEEIESHKYIPIYISIYGAGSMTEISKDEILGNNTDYTPR